MSVPFQQSLKFIIHFKADTSTQHFLLCDYLYCFCRLNKQRNQRLFLSYKNYNHKSTTSVAQVLHYVKAKCPLNIIKLNAHKKIMKKSFNLLKPSKFSSSTPPPLSETSISSAP